MATPTRQRPGASKATMLSDMLPPSALTSPVRRSTRVVAKVSPGVIQPPTGRSRPPNKMTPTPARPRSRSPNKATQTKKTEAPAHGGNVNNQKTVRGRPRSSFQSPPPIQALPSLSTLSSALVGRLAEPGMMTNEINSEDLRKAGIIRWRDEVNRTAEDPPPTPIGRLGIIPPPTARRAVDPTDGQRIKFAFIPPNTCVETYMEDVNAVLSSRKYSVHGVALEQMVQAEGLAKGYGFHVRLLIPQIPEGRMGWLVLGKTEEFAEIIAKRMAADDGQWRIASPRKTNIRDV